MVYLDRSAAWIPYRNKATREQWLKEDIGYVPRKPLAAVESLAEASGALAGHGAVLGAFAPLTAGIQVPALRVLARWAVNGVLASLLQTPEGDDSIVERARQIPGNVFFFTLLDAGILTASKVAEIIKWNRQYASVAEEAGWVRYEKVEPIVVPGQRAEFTAKQVRDLYIKMQRNAAGENIPFTVEEQAAINDLNRPLTDPSLRPRGEAASGGVGNGWTPAVKQGWIGPAGTEGWFRGTKYTPVGFPRQPEFSDIFRATPRPNPPMAAGPRTVWSAETGAPPPETAPPRVLGAAAAPGMQPPPPPSPPGEPPPAANTYPNSYRHR